MKTLHYFIIAILIFSTSLYIKPIQADNENDVVIQNIQTLPTAIIIGQTFKINATLINNSSNPIFIEHGSCGSPFSVTFDNHVVVRTNNVTCTLELIEQRIDPGTKITSTSPYLDLTYVAAENGTVNTTVSFPYNFWNQTSQSNTQENITKPFSFTIYPKTRIPTLTPSGNPALIDVALSIPGLQKWSNDWQFVSMGFMTAKNQPGNWQYVTVNLKASSNSSLIPCDNNNEDWSAMVVIDRTTMKVIQANYPTLESHNCSYTTGGGPASYGGTIPKIDTPLKQFKSGIAAKDVTCKQGLQLIFKFTDYSPACVTPQTKEKLFERGWGTEILAHSHPPISSQPNPMTGTKTSDPFGITALIIYHSPDLCLNPTSHSIPYGMPSCPPNKFYLKINSNSTAYLMGYNICDGNSCATNNNLSLILPLNAGLNPDYQMIGLPVNLPWKYGDTVGIQLYVSSTDDNKTASLVDLGNSAIVP
jgi:hypothetical protein